MDNIGSIIVVVLVIVAAIVVWIVVERVRGTVSQASQLLFGTDNLAEGIAKRNYEVSTTPKSVAAATSLLLPQIQADFPEFNLADMRVRAENVLVSYLHAIDCKDASLLSEGSKELRQSLALRISLLSDARQQEDFDKIKVHRVEIARYQKRDGRCDVTFQCSVQYKYALRGEGGTVLKGNPDVLTQTRYNVEMVYVQDRGKVESAAHGAANAAADAGLGINCPNCGAPVTSLGAKFCVYCGTPIVELNIYAWTFHAVSEV